MATSNQVVQTTLQWQLDKASLQETLAGNRALSDSLQQQVVVGDASITQQQQITEATLQASIAAQEQQASISLLVDAVQKGEIATGDLVVQLNALGATKTQIDQVAAAMTNLSTAADNGGGDGSGASLTGSRRGLMALGSLAGGSPGLSDAARIVSVTAAFGPMGLAAGAAAIAVKAVTDAETARAKAAQDAADALKNIASGAAGGTTESINKEIQQQQAQKSVLDDVQKSLSFYNEELKSAKTNLDRGQISQEEYTTVVGQIGDEVDKLTGGAVTASGGVVDLNKLLDDNKQSTDAVTIKIGGLNIELGTAAVAANNAAAALEKQSKLQVSVVGLIQKADQMTDDQRLAREKEIEREIELNREALGSGQLTGDAKAVILQQDRDLNIEYKSLITAQSTYAQGLLDEENEKKRITDATNNYLDAVTKEGEAEVAVAKAQQDLAGAAADHAAQLVQINQDEHAKEADDRKKAAQTAAEDAQKEQDRLQEIRQQGAQQHEADVGNRDALANYKDKQATDTQLSKEEKTYNTQEAQLQAHLTETLDADKAAQKKAEQTENTSYTKRYNQLLQSLNDAQIAESRAAGLAAAYQAQANQNRLVMEVNHQNALIGTTQIGLGLVEAAFQQTMNNLLGIVQGAANPFQNSIVIGNQLNNQIQQTVNQQITKVVRGATHYF